MFMKNVLFVILFIQTGSLFAQDFCNKWTIGINAGGPIILTTSTSKTSFTSLNHYEASLRRNFNPNKGVKADFHLDDLNFTDNSPGTSMLHFSLQGTYNLLAIKNKDINQRFKLISHAGIGYAAMWNRSYATGKNKIGVLNNGSIDEMFQLMVGLTPTIHLTRNLSLNADVTIMANALQDNGFDFKTDPLTGRFGAYGVASIGIGYSFGCPKNPVITSNPKDLERIAALQKDLENQKSKLGDDDNDGIVNANDMEPNTPAGAKVDSKGAQIIEVVNDPNTTDTDLDGVVDALDNCPTIKGTVNGCPEASIEEQDAKTLQELGILDILFVKGSFYVNATYYPILDKLVAYMNANPTIKIDVSGHADIDGADEVNNKLSEARVNAVVEYLTKKGVEKNQLVISSMGKKQTKYQGNTLEVDAANRRVSFSIHR
jgi:OOP family OmpA-OmpF porin